MSIEYCTGCPAGGNRSRDFVSHVYRGVLVRLGLRNKTGFHECPKCKSRSVWRADPYGTLEETLHQFLRLLPYRCARCDQRFLDSKLPPSEASPPSVSRWFSLARFTASRLLHRAPFDETLRQYSLFGQDLPAPGLRNDGDLLDSPRHLSRHPKAEPTFLGEESGF